MKIDRIIISSNNNVNYINYWPLVAHSWKKFTPTLFFIGDKKDFKFSEIKGTNVYFLKPLPTISSCHYSRIIRIFAPILFPGETCLITDIDILPLKPDYFSENIEKLSDKMFISFTSDAYPTQNWRLPLCYYCGKGSTFASILNIPFNQSFDTYIKLFNDKINYWYKLKYYCSTDEYAFSVMLRTWKHYRTNVIKIQRNTHPSKPYIYQRMTTRLFLVKTKPDLTKIKLEKYIDVTLPRPFHKNYKYLLPILKYIDYTGGVTKYGTLTKRFPNGISSKYRSIKHEMIIKIRNMKFNTTDKNKIHSEILELLK
jgi:hypothetical protein